MHRHGLTLVAFVLSTLAAPAAQAHIAMSEPAPRRPDQKAGPCGLGANDPRGPNVTTFQGGETIMVRWTETVEHPGHFRISFDPDGQDDFADPAGYDDFYSNPAVLVDQIADKVGFGSTYEQEITLPLMSCDNCTLQLVQVMTDKPPYEIGTNDLYYQCADIMLMGADETTGDTTDATTGDATTGGPGTSGDATSGSTADATSATGNTSDPTSGGGNTTGDGTGGSGGSTGTGDTDTGQVDAVDKDGGCGCDSGGAGGAGLAALVLLGLRRRRK